MPRVHDYSFHPELDFQDIGFSTLAGDRHTPNTAERKYIGFELEAELVDYGKYPDGSHCVAEAIPGALFDSLNIFLKRDGSLRDGFEIVTHPRTVRLLQSQKEQWHEFLNWLSNQGMRSYDTGRCGLHIHMSLNHFDSVSHGIRVVDFLSSNAAFSLALSRRSTNSLANYARLVSTQALKDLKFAPDWFNIASESGCAIGRHSCAQFSRYGTMELRLFRGTLNTESLFAYVDMSQALVKWTQKNPIKYNDVNGFIEFCKSEYPNAGRLAEIAQRKTKLKKYKDADGLTLTRSINPSRTYRNSYLRSHGALVPAWASTIPRPWYMNPAMWATMDTPRMIRCDYSDPLFDNTTALNMAASMACFSWEAGRHGDDSRESEQWRRRNRTALTDAGFNIVSSVALLQQQIATEYRHAFLHRIESSSGIMICRGMSGISNYWRPTDIGEWSERVEVDESFHELDSALRKIGFFIAHGCVFGAETFQVGSPIVLDRKRPYYFERHEATAWADSNLVILPTRMMSQEYWDECVRRADALGMEENDIFATFGDDLVYRYPEPIEYWDGPEEEEDEDC